MDSLRTQNPQAALTSLEAAAASTRGGFGCMFSTSEEFELALITERRAQGRYDQRRIGCAMIVAGAVLLFR